MATSRLWKHEANEDKEAACVRRPESIPGQVEFFDEGKAQFCNVGMTPELTFVSKRGLKHCGTLQFKESQGIRLFRGRASRTQPRVLPRPFSGNEGLTPWLPALPEGAP